MVSPFFFVYRALRWFALFPLIPMSLGVQGFFNTNSAWRLESCLFYHFAQKTESSEQPLASFRLSSRSAHPVTKPLFMVESGGVDFYSALTYPSARVVPRLKCDRVDASEKMPGSQ
jgi:hypothetical protein